MSAKRYPLPPIPPDADLRGMAWMPYYGDHLARSTLNARISDAGYRAAHNLWWAAWNSVPAASLPDDEIILTRLADLGRDVETFRRIKDECLHGFIRCSDGRLYHIFLAGIALDAWGRRLHDRERKRQWRLSQGRDGDATGTGHGRDTPLTGEKTGQDRTVSYVSGKGDGEERRKVRRRSAVPRGTKVNLVVLNPPAVGDDDDWCSDLEDMA